MQISTSSGVSATEYFSEAQVVLSRLPLKELDELAKAIKVVRRLFIVGLGGSLGNASHAVNDFRKLCGIESHCPENLSEITAHANDNSWDDCYRDWLELFDPSPNDGLLVLSVGGGTTEVSVPLVRAIGFARTKRMRVFGILGRNGGYTKKVADVSVVIPTTVHVTPHTESFQSMILHFLVTHLQISETKW